jgi:hypothetical protein
MKSVKLTSLAPREDIAVSAAKLMSWGVFVITLHRNAARYATGLPNISKSPHFCNAPKPDLCSKTQWATRSVWQWQQNYMSKEPTSLIGSSTLTTASCSLTMQGDIGFGRCLCKLPAKFSTKNLDFGGCVRRPSAKNQRTSARQRPLILPDYPENARTEKPFPALTRKMVFP